MSPDRRRRQRFLTVPSEPGSTAQVSCAGPRNRQRSHSGVRQESRVELEPAQGDGRRATYDGVLVVVEDHSPRACRRDQDECTNDARSDRPDGQQCDQDGSG